MTSSKSNFNSKVLLFGEYSVVRSGDALCLPYSLFDGHLTFPKENVRIDSELKALCQYLKKLKNEQRLLIDLDVTSFEFDISQGLSFNSTIPQGYGVGSSGALCAAVFDRYHNGDLKALSEVDLKAAFAQIESHFHGSSSGIDPLISYYNRPIKIVSKGQLEFVDLPIFEGKGKGAIFLLNTGRPRRTEPLVNLFLEKCKTDSFSKLCDQVLLPINDNCIEHFLCGDVDRLYEDFKELSDFQFRHFAPMIPKLCVDIWENGINGEDYFLKLCGAGGGGFLLGMTKDFDKAANSLSGHEIRPLIRFP